MDYSGGRPRGRAERSFASIASSNGGLSGSASAAAVIAASSPSVISSRFLRARRRASSFVIFGRPGFTAIRTSFAILRAFFGSVVDQILDLNRTNPEQISLAAKAVDFTALLQQTISDLYPEISRRDQQIALQGDHAVLNGNAFALGLLCQNLIVNACKYTPEGGQIRVATVVAEQQVTLLVEDSGPGIAATEYQRVFDRFYRVGGDRHHSSVIGCGLGLAIVKHIVQLHDAIITLSSSAALGGLKVTVDFTPTKVPGAKQILTQQEKEQDKVSDKATTAESNP